MVHQHPLTEASIPPRCVYYNSAGFAYEEIGCLYPFLQPFYTKWEQTYDPYPVYEFMLKYPWIPFAMVTLYGMFIILGRRYFQNQSAWNWRLSLAVWNFGLSAFSCMGALRTVPHVLHNLTTYTLRENFCHDPEYMGGSGTCGFWMMLFVLSKIPELGDTFFIIIHKKPLMFLHWYHHITVLLYCWLSYTGHAPAGLIFGPMNYIVHAFMYGYYFLMAIKMKPKWMKPQFITIAQITQMIFGVIATCLSFYYYFNTEGNHECLSNRANNMLALVMYGSYLFLFLQFFMQRYNKKTK